jgi:hypothetical protein
MNIEGIIEPLQAHVMIHVWFVNWVIASLNWRIAELLGD